MASWNNRSSLLDGETLEPMCELNCSQKPEGLWFSEDRSRREFFVVTDTDHSSSPSQLYKGTIHLD